MGRMSDYYDAFEMSPVPNAGPDTVPPEPFRGIYAMPAFVTIPTTDLAASTDFWIRGLGFIELFSIPGGVVHLRRWAFQDVLLVPGQSVPEQTPAMSVSFSCVLSQVGSLVEACRALRPDSVDGPRDTPWNTRDVEVITPENARIILTAAKRFDPDSEEARSLAAVGITPPGAVAATMGSMHDVTATDGLTVGQVATRLGVTVRALHHWDDMALARPSLRTTAGYRLYTAGDLERLHRIVVYRETGLGLDRIRAILDDSTADVPGALRAQRTQVAERIDRLQQLNAGLDRMIDAHERGLLLTVEQQAALFGPQWNPDWPAQARQLYGDTPQWQQYAERSASRSPEEWRAIADTVADLDRALGDAVDAGVVPGSPEANQLVERHREVFTSSFFTLTRQMQVCLGRKYETDPEFAAHYDGIRAGLATWFRQSVDASARAHSIDPDTATWQ